MVELFFLTCDEVVKYILRKYAVLPQRTLICVDTLYMPNFGIAREPIVTKFPEDVYPTVVIVSFVATWSESVSMSSCNFYQ